MSYLLYAVAFVAALTAVVRLTGLRVRTGLSYSRTFGLTALMVGLVLLVWWFLSRGGPETRIVHPIILPSPMEVLGSYPELHFQQGLVRCIYASWVRVTSGFLLAVVIAIPLGVYMATFEPIAAFFRPLSLAGAYVPIVVFI